MTNGRVNSYYVALLFNVVGAGSYLLVSHDSSQFGCDNFTTWQFIGSSTLDRKKKKKKTALETIVYMPIQDFPLFISAPTVYIRAVPRADIIL